MNGISVSQSTFYYLFLYCYITILQTITQKKLVHRTNYFTEQTSTQTKVAKK